MRAEAAFCVGCGSRVRAPTECPSCRVSVPALARFCPGCGQGLLARRPPAAAEAVPPAAAPELPPAPPVKGEAGAVLADLERSRPKSPLFLNVLSLVAVLLAFLAFTVFKNRDAPKSVSPFAGGPPPSRAEAAAPPAGGAGVVGRVSLAPGQAAPPGATLFVIARTAGAGDRGPPLAVQRIQSPALPLEFSLGPADVMIAGMPLTLPLDVSARLDGDGNAMTKDPSDVVGGPVRASGGAIEIVLGAPAPAAAPTPAPAPAPAPAAAPAAVAAPAGAAPIAGQIRLGPGLASPGGVVFVILRPAGAPPRSPPIAVTKVDATSFPLPFEVGPGDVMLAGQSLSGPFDVYVRLDQDGNAMSRAPGDLEAEPTPGVVPPAKLEIVLSKRTEAGGG